MALPTMQAGIRQAFNFHPHAWGPGQFREGQSGLQGRMWTASWGRLGIASWKPSKNTVNAVDDGTLNKARF